LWCLTFSTGRHARKSKGPGQSAEKDVPTPDAGGEVKENANSITNEVAIVLKKGAKEKGRGAK